MGLKELIQSCKTKNRKAQEELYRLYATKLFGLCLKYSANRQEAEDSLQDGFITIFQKIDQFKNQGSFEGWMKRIMINTALQKHRQQKLYALTNEEGIEEEVEVEIESEQLSAGFLLECVQELPIRYRQVFSLYVLDGFSHREISKLLGISEGTSKSNLARARLKLKEIIERKQSIQNSAHTI